MIVVDSVLHILFGSSINVVHIFVVFLCLDDVVLLFEPPVHYLSVLVWNIETMRFAYR